MRNPRSLLPLTSCQSHDFFGDASNISDRSGIYIVGYWLNFQWIWVYVGLASNLKTRTSGKHRADPGTTDRGLVEYCHEISRHHQVKLFTYPMPKIMSWIRHREAALIRGLKPSYNTRQETASLSLFWAFVDGVLLTFSVTYRLLQVLGIGIIAGTIAKSLGLI